MDTLLHKESIVLGTEAIQPFWRLYNIVWSANCIAKHVGTL